MTTQDITHPPGKYRLRIEDYVLLDASGAFAGARTELVEGDVIVMSPQYRPHMRVKDELAYRLRRALEAVQSDLFVGTEASVMLSEHDLPQPDIVLTHEPDGEGPIPLASVALIVEVASTTLDQDLGTKAALYAAAGVPEYWVADVAARVLHQMWGTGDSGYAQRHEVAFGERVAAVTVAGLVVRTGGVE